MDFQPQRGDVPRMVLRGGAILGLISAGMLVLVPLRGVEKALHGPSRPWTPWLVHWVSRACRFALGIRCIRRGRPVKGTSTVFVANHVSWIDILSLNAETPMTFVAKADVAGWPGIGFMARAAGTVFIERDPRQVAAQSEVLASKIAAGHRILIFPEGTSSDGLRVLPFRPSLFQAFLKSAPVTLQPITLRYEAPDGQDERFYGWWGDMDMGPSLKAILACRRPGRLTITFHDGIQVTEGTHRKALAKQAEDVVRSAL